MTRDEFVTKLRALHACNAACAYVEAQAETATADEIWAACPNGGWLEWLVGECNVGDNEYDDGYDAEYDAICVPALAAYRAIHTPARAKYFGEGGGSPEARAAYNAVAGPAWAAFAATENQALADCIRRTYPLCPLEA